MTTRKEIAKKIQSVFLHNDYITKDVLYGVTQYYVEAFNYLADWHISEVALAEKRARVEVAKRIMLIDEIKIEKDLAKLNVIHTRNNIDISKIVLYISNALKTAYKHGFEAGRAFTADKIK